ncbi:rhomboid-domain-containing protein [Phlegmacium glaucopus]|nr:rhomboid-domain-containing protein [Phlegmacium glaucopus]
MLSCFSPIGTPSVDSNYRPIFTSAPLSLRYHPPQNPQQARRFLGFLDKIPQNFIFYGIIGINSVVFTMWYMAVQKYKQQGDPSTVLWMRENFLSSWNNLVSGRLWTPLTSCFSHQDLSHILFNGFTFFFMAQPMLQILGSRQFIFLYLGGGLISSFSSIAYAKLSGKMDYASHGASGAIYSIVSLFACVAPTTKFQLYGIVPVPAWLVVTGLFSYDLYSTLSNKSGTTDTVGHVSGILAGVAYFVLRRF